MPSTVAKHAEESCSRAAFKPVQRDDALGLVKHRFRLISLVRLKQSPLKEFRHRVLPVLVPNDSIAWAPLETGKAQHFKKSEFFQIPSYAD